MGKELRRMVLAALGVLLLILGASLLWQIAHRGIE